MSDRQRNDRPGLTDCARDLMLRAEKGQPLLKGTEGVLEAMTLPAAVREVGAPLIQLVATGVADPERQVQALLRFLFHWACALLFLHGGRGDLAVVERERARTLHEQLPERVRVAFPLEVNDG